MRGIAPIAHRRRSSAANGRDGALHRGNLRRTLPRVAALPPEDQPQALRAIVAELCEEWVRPRRGRVVPQGVKRKMSNFPLRSRDRHPSRFVHYTPQIITN